MCACSTDGRGIRRRGRGAAREHGQFSGRRSTEQATTYDGDALLADEHGGERAVEGLLRGAGRGQAPYAHVETFAGVARRGAAGGHGGEIGVGDGGGGVRGAVVAVCGRDARRRWRRWRLHKFELRPHWTKTSRVLPRLPIRIRISLRALCTHAHPDITDTADALRRMTTGMTQRWGGTNCRRLHARYCTAASRRATLSAVTPGLTARTASNTDSERNTCSGRAIIHRYTACYRASKYRRSLVLLRLQALSARFLRNGIGV